MRTFLTFITSFLLIIPVYAFDGKGSGTVNDPYQITNAVQLQSMQEDAAANYMLMNNIDASETKEWNDGAGFVPICPHLTYPFHGNLNGQGYTISNLYVNLYNDIADSIAFGGLFGHVGALGDLYPTVQNILLRDCDVYAESENYSVYAGGFCGYNSGAVIKNCYVSGKVGGKTGSVKKWTYIGGFAGVNQYEISNSCFEGTVSSESDNVGVGGFTSFSNGGTLTDCYAVSEVSCIAKSGISSGLVGYMEGGGITRCYSSSTISTECSDANYTDYIIGYYKSGTVKNIIFDLGYNGVVLRNGATGLSGEAMKKKTNYSGSGWDFDNTWCIIENESFPKLQYFTDGDCMLTSVEDIVTEIETISISTFPNPATDYINIHSCGNEMIDEIYIYNLNGEIISHINTLTKKENYRIDLKKYVPGAYLIEVHSGNKVNSSLFTVTH